MTLETEVASDDARDVDVKLRVPDEAYESRLYHASFNRACRVAEKC